ASVYIVLMRLFRMRYRIRLHKSDQIISAESCGED
ncbi:MAG: hypothetical protein ACI9OU_002323, partial [Candidatus Promineifilaceae bacterium]